MPGHEVMAGPKVEMSKQLCFPIFVFEENNDCQVFLSQKDVAIGLESYDIENDEYHGYDYFGRILTFELTKNRRAICLLKDDQSDGNDRLLLKQLRKSLEMINADHAQIHDASLVKAMSAGYFSKTYFEYPSLWRKFKRLFTRKS